MELAQGLGLSVRGIGFPGHFMVKVNLPMGQAVIDPLTGRSLSREELAERLDPFRRRSGLVDEFAYLLPADCTPITDEEAQVIQAEIEANQPAPVEPTPQQKLASAGLSVDELKELLGIA
jgi:regulator of sirC expression with transglutaminase-like and TPR domain